MARLARLTDPRALDEQEGARARYSVAVPQSWFDAEAEIELALPKVLMCARCDGGGCDGCERSGALRAPVQEKARRVRLHVPRSPGRLRLVDPFQDESVAQLFVEVRVGALSGGARRLDVPRRAPRLLLVVATALVLLVLIIALLAFR